MTPSSPIKVPPACCGTNLVTLVKELVSCRISSASTTPACSVKCFPSPWLDRRNLSCQALSILHESGINWIHLPLNSYPWYRVDDSHDYIPVQDPTHTDTDNITTPERLIPQRWAISQIMILNHILFGNILSSGVVNIPSVFSTPDFLFYRLGWEGKYSPSKEEGKDPNRLSMCGQSTLCLAVPCVPLGTLIQAQWSPPSPPTPVIPAWWEPGRWQLQQSHSPHSTPPPTTLPSTAHTHSLLKLFRATYCIPDCTAVLLLLLCSVGCTESDV
jgi:hypothetical protein